MIDRKVPYINSDGARAVSSIDGAKLVPVTTSGKLYTVNTAISSIGGSTKLFHLAKATADPSGLLKPLSGTAQTSVLPSGNNYPSKRQNSDYVFKQTKPRMDGPTF